MANKIKPIEAGTGGAAPTKAAPAKKFPLEKLRENCRQLFGVSDSTFAGATYGLNGDFTVEEIKAHIEAWKKKGVEKK